LAFKRERIAPDNQICVVGTDDHNPQTAPFIRQRHWENDDSDYNPFPRTPNRIPYQDSRLQDFMRNSQIGTTERN